MDKKETWNLTPEERKGIATRMKAARMLVEKNQQEMAQFLKVSQTNISSIETGARLPSFEVIYNLTKNGFDMEWFLFGKDPKAKDDLQMSRDKMDIKVYQLNETIKTLKFPELEAVEDFIKLIERMKKEFTLQALLEKEDELK